jgi:hypothetical protein
MERLLLAGKIRWVGDNIYIKTEKYYGKQKKYEEVCLNDYIKEKIKEKSKVVIAIDVVIK